jgi:transcriptional regulator with XRE-family HTH domain
MSELIFSDRLKSVMAEKGINQDALAKGVGVSQGAVSGWLNKATPSSDKIAKIAAFMGISAEWLLTGKAAKPYSLQFMGAGEIESRLREEMPIYGTDWKTRAIEAEGKLAALKTSLADLLNKH